MIFYKKRDFGELIGDTFNFFKKYGKNFIWNYLLINGGVVILFFITVVIGYGEIIKQFIGGNIQGEAYIFENFFNDNQGLLIITSLIILVLMILLGLIAFSFPAIYMKKVAETGKEKLTTEEIISGLKENVGKLIIFFLGTTFILAPIYMVMMGVLTVLGMMLVGYLLMLIAVPIFLNIVNLSLFHMIHTDEGFFASVGKAISMQFSNSFWKYVGSTIVLYIIIQLAMSILLIIPVAALVFVVFSMDAGASEASMFMIVISMIVYFLAILVGMLQMNLLYVNTGFLYYDGREDLQREASISEIDQIGQDIE